MPSEFSPGTRLILSAPAHSGLPNGAPAMVESSRWDEAAASWVYSVRLGDIVKDVPAGWLRNENRIATAKACSSMPFEEFTRLGQRLLVPLFQRRYCWER